MLSTRRDSALHAVLAAKGKFEDMARDHGESCATRIFIGSKVKSFNGDGANLQEYRQGDASQEQALHQRKCQQNASIRTIMSIARDNDVTSPLHWPEMADLVASFAVDYAVYLFNRVPDPRDYV
jgi:hypothetical protein